MLTKELSRLTGKVMNERNFEMKLKCSSLIPGFKFDFSSAFNGIKKNLKKAGKGETDHFAPLPENVVASIHKFLGQIQKVMEARVQSNPHSYETALKSLPHEFRNNYHEYLQLGAEYVVMTFDIRRGREGMADLVKDHFEIVEENGFKYFKKVKLFFFFQIQIK